VSLTERRVAQKALWQGGTRGFVLLAGAGVLVLAILLLALSPTVATWVVLVGGLVFVALAAPLAALCLVPFAVAFGSLVSLAVRGIHVGPTDVLVAALALSWLVRAWAARRGHPSSLRASFHALRPALAASWRRDWASAAAIVALVAYFAVVALSLAVAVDRASAAKEIVKWGEVLVLLGLTWRYVRTLGQVRLLVWSIVLAGVAEAIVGCAQWALAQGSLGPGGASARVFGTFGQPNPFGGYLNFALPCALALVLFGDDARERWVAGAASALLLIAQALANSRGAELGILAAVLALLVVGFRRERLAGLVALVGVPLLVLAWATRLVPASVQEKLLAQARLNDVLSGQINDANFSTVERLAHWIAGLRMFSAHPLLGVGAGNYAAAYPAYALPDWPDALGHAHNYYINVAAETGLLGLLAFLAVVVASLAVGWRAAHVARGSDGARAGSWPRLDRGHVLALCLFAALAALTIHNLTDDLFVHAIEQQFALVLGCLLAVRSHGKQDG
jgi:O-antigen ligase